MGQVGGPSMGMGAWQYTTRLSSTLTSGNGTYHLAAPSTKHHTVATESQNPNKNSIASSKDVQRQDRLLVLRPLQGRDHNGLLQLGHMPAGTHRRAHVRRGLRQQELSQPCSG
ncbi:hypothetical protein MAPG_08602 [Magnaporthiopsis poae ATCC 64411]|uniref:Uncharacterized protein n=1 Tax=Magnaporthiopsis poae (strain ATCC 64411 / 73-15) TaxID=644358 RepID=A0A0C4E7T0_MAGP6|nr:hypothetical protein MAPG_08602 [Magnaporthiopsis poae ATCC 64411]